MEPILIIIAITYIIIFTHSMISIVVVYFDVSAIFHFAKDVDIEKAGLREEFRVLIKGVVIANRDGITKSCCGISPSPTAKIAMAIKK